MTTDRQLVEAAAGGDREAFDDLVRRHQASILTLIRVLTAGDTDAEDLAQEVFVRAWRGLAAFRAESAFRTWLHRIALNVVSTHRGGMARWRRLFWKPSNENDAALVERVHRTRGDEIESSVVTREAIDRALRSLPEDLRIAVVLRDLQGLEYREIADATGVPIGTVESRIFRARERLRPMLAGLRGPGSEKQQ